MDFRILELSVLKLRGILYPLKNVGSLDQIV